VAFLLTLIPGLWTQFIIPIFLVMTVGIPFNTKFPDIYLKSRGMGGMEKLETIAAPPIKSSLTTFEINKDDHVTMNYLGSATTMMAKTPQAPLGPDRASLLVQHPVQHPVPDGL